MDGIKNIVKGEALFVMGFFGVLILNYIIPTLISVGEGLISGTDIADVIWFGLIIIYLLFMVVTPMYFIVKGMQGLTDDNKMGNIAIGVLIFVFNMALTIKGWYVIETFTNVAQTMSADGTMSADPFVLVLFWVGLLLVWSTSTLIAPAYIIIKNTQR